MNEVVLGTIVGILMGPYCADIFSPRSWSLQSDAITLEVMRVVLAIGLFTLGADLPSAYLSRHLKGLTFMIVPTMAVGWLIVAGKSVQICLKRVLRLTSLLQA